MFTAVYVLVSIYLSGKWVNGWRPPSVISEFWGLGDTSFFCCICAIAIHLEININLVDMYSWGFAFLKESSWQWVIVSVSSLNVPRRHQF